MNASFVTCDFCDKSYIKGTGHLCWCAECSNKHSMCNECYKKGIKNNTIAATPDNKMMYNRKTIKEGI